MMLVLKQLLGTVQPWLSYLPAIAFLAGALVAILRVRSRPLPAVLAFVAFSLLLTSTITRAVLYRFMHEWTMYWGESARYAVSGGLFLLRYTGWILLLFALFHQGDPQPGEKLPSAQFVYGGFLARFAAFFVDQVLTSPIAAIPSFFVAFAIPRVLGEAGLPLVVLLLFAIDIFARWIYFAGLESGSMRATVGKQLLGLQVVNLDGGQISFGRATARHFSKGLSAFFLLGYLAQLRTPRRQAWHDSISGCIVIRNKKKRRSTTLDRYSQQRRGR